MDNRCDVLVVGAGPTGLMLAGELLRHGATVRIIDEVDQRPRWSKATIIMPRTLEILDLAGTVRPFLENGLRLDGLVLYSGKSKIFELTGADIDSPYPFVVGLEQFRTEEILKRRLTSMGGQVESQKTLVELSAAEDTVTAVVRLGDGSQEVVSSNYLVGCDGAHSFVRDALGLPFVGASVTTDHFAVAYLPIEWELPRDRMVELHSPHGTVIANPLPNNLWSILFELDAAQWEQAPHDAPTLAELQETLDARSPVPARLSEPIWTTYFHINHRQVPVYRVGPVFLAGDAAHIHSPAGGQGMNTGLQDAANLAWKLGLVCGGKAPDQLLDSYDAERRPVAREVLEVTTELQAELDLRNRVMMALRDHALHLVDHVAPARRAVARLLGELGYTYRTGPLSAEESTGRSYLRHEARHPSFIDCCEFGSGPRAGDRAPDVSVRSNGRGRGDQATRLYDLLRGQLFTLLLFEGTHRKKASDTMWKGLKDIAVAIESKYHDLIGTIVVTPQFETPAYMDWMGQTVHDGSGELHHRYGARGECLYLIRPDGHIAYRSEPADRAGLERYLCGITLLATLST